MTTNRDEVSPDVNAITRLIRDKIENLRPKLLDLTRKNPLISTRLTGRSNSYIRAVDELPDALFFQLAKHEKMRFRPLPALGEDPIDETSQKFQNVLSEARLTDSVYAEALNVIDPADESALIKQRNAERALRDRVRDSLGMAPRQTKHELSLSLHARNNGISPSYDLPLPEDEHEDGRHSDEDIQTLLLPDALERTANSLITKCRTWQQETGINVLHAAFGYLEWEDASGKEKSYSPLVLVPVKIEKIRTTSGPEFWIEGTGEPGEMNTVLFEKLRLEFDLKLPGYVGGSIEQYMSEIADAAPRNMTWRVRRYVTFGVFPSARMAMYFDLDTSRQAFRINDVVDQLFGGTSADPSSSPFADEYEVDQAEIEAKVPLLVTDADSSQFSTIVDIADGKNVAVEGPPGTGKSQTIINTIAAALIEGKKVLFVAEKMAALDVVRARLEAMKLGEFILPLQANRSSREQVVNSIRDRVENDAISRPVDYELRVQKFRTVREELSRYIALISQPYKGTGFTVHDILGRSLVTSERLASLPQSLQSPVVVGLDNYDQHKIQTIRELAAALEKEWEETESVDDYWRGLEIAALDPFTAAEILRRASEAAELYRAVNESREALSSVGILPQAGDEEISRIRQILVAISPHASSIQGPLVDTIIRSGRLRELRELLTACDIFREQRETLSMTLQGPLDAELAEQLREMHRICKENDFNTLDVEALERRQNELAQSLKGVEIAERELTDFLLEAPELTECSIGELIHARRIIGDTNLEVLAARSELAGDPAAAPLIERAVKQGYALKACKEELARTVDVDNAPSAHEISEHVSALRSTSSLSVLSSRYRSAKKTYKKLSRDPNFNRHHAAYVMAKLADWKNEEKRFLSDDQVKIIFGIHYDGMETNFDLFTELLAYNRRIDEEFSGASKRRLRKFLKTADLDLLKSMPELDAGDVSLTFPKLGREIGLRRTKLDLIGKNIARLREFEKRIRENNRPRPSDLSELADLLDAHELKRKSIEESCLRNMLGDRFDGVETAGTHFADDLAVAQLLLDARECAATIQPLVRDGRVPEALRIVEAFASALSAGHGAIDGLSKQTGIPRDQFLPQSTYPEIVERLEAAARDGRGLNAHAAYFSAFRELQEADMAQPAHELLNSGHGLAALDDILEAVIFRALSMRVYSDFGSKLTRYNGARLDALRRQLAALDREIIANSRSQLRAALVRNSNPPVGNGRGKKSTYTEMSLLKNEINKQRGFYPVRDLTRRAGKALLELKPCWMMSPLSIAQYLEPGTVEFDLCIVDEASQMPPENAIGALLRSRQVMIVGDTNQLPPTSFFRKMVEDEDADEDETVLEESILEMANATFRPGRRLRWHYRSRHSGLIRFSNRMIYDDDLIVFPSANENRPDMGVTLVSVEGTYKSGTNAAEASAIVEQATRFMKQCPQRSLGIVVLNQKQRDLILEEMEYALNRDQSASKYVDFWSTKNDGLESFFVKNLENVQGDERDVIFIGTVYGPETLGGRVLQRFGPINGLAGKRRLNVLFSRAKKQIVTFSSMTTADIKTDENGNPGAYMLKRWLEYAATGVLDPGITTEREPDSDFEVFVIQQIRAMGCEPVPQVGVAGYFIDIGVRHPDWPHGYLLGVECDGAAYHSSKSARDRDRLRQEVLEGLGWHLHRIWSTDWFQDPRNEAEKLRYRIEERLAEEKATVPPLFSSSITDIVDAKREPVEARETVRVADSTEGSYLGNQLQREALITKQESQKRLAPTKRIPRSTQIEVGDTVRVRYLSGDQKTLVVTLSDAKDAPNNGLVHINKPLGKALLGAELEDQIEVLVGSRIRSACVEEIIKQETA